MQTNFPSLWRVSRDDSLQSPNIQHFKICNCHQLIFRILVSQLSDKMFFLSSKTLPKNTILGIGKHCIVKDNLVKKRGHHTNLMGGSSPTELMAMAKYDQAAVMELWEGWTLVAGSSSNPGSLLNSLKRSIISQRVTDKYQIYTSLLVWSTGECGGELGQNCGRMDSRRIPNVPISWDLHQQNGKLPTD